MRKRSDGHFCRAEADLVESPCKSLGGGIEHFDCSMGGGKKMGEARGFVAGPRAPSSFEQVAGHCCCFSLAPAKTVTGDVGREGGGKKGCMGPWANRDAGIMPIHSHTIRNTVSVACRMQAQALGAGRRRATREGKSTKRRRDDSLPSHRQVVLIRNYVGTWVGRYPGI